jgi:ArsR family transcriptional regulator, arsenate/arsenite/antimonite-responsive transcriptional repressor
MLAAMATAFPVLSPRERQAGGCCTPAVEPDLSAAEAEELATVVKALANAARLQIVDALRKAAPEAICQCELVPLFDMRQQALARHLKVLAEAGVVGSERRGLWTYYYVKPEALEQLRTWLS